MIKPALILVAEDDPDDRLMIKESFTEAELDDIPLSFVGNGEELLDYLNHRNKYQESMNNPLPGLILLDLNMPRKDGREALREIKADPGLRRIPIVIFSTSKTEEDIARTYDLGVNSFITKPVTFEGLVNIVRTLAKYWMEIVELPV